MKKLKDALDLDAIRARRLCILADMEPESALVVTAAWHRRVDFAMTSDVPALIAEVKRLRDGVAEVARLKEQLDGVLAAVDAEPDYRGTHDATHIKRNIKARILAEKGES